MLKNKEINLAKILIKSKDGNSYMKWEKIKIKKFKFIGRNMRKNTRRSRKK